MIENKDTTLETAKSASIEETPDRKHGKLLAVRASLHEKLSGTAGLASSPSVAEDDIVRARREEKILSVMNTDTGLRLIDIRRRVSLKAGLADETVLNMAKEGRLRRTLDGNELAPDQIINRKPAERILYLKTSVNVPRAAGKVGSKVPLAAVASPLAQADARTTKELGEELRKQLVDIITENPGIINRDISRITGMTRSHLRVHLDKLVAIGRIYRVDKNGRILPRDEKNLQGVKMGYEVNKDFDGGEIHAVKAKRKYEHRDDVKRAVKEAIYEERRRKFLVFLGEKGQNGATFGQIRETNTGLNWNKVTRELKILEAGGQIVRTLDGRRLEPEDKVSGGGGGEGTRVIYLIAKYAAAGTGGRASEIVPSATKAPAVTAAAVHADVEAITGLEDNVHSFRAERILDVLKNGESLALKEILKKISLMMKEADYVMTQLVKNSLISRTLQDGTILSPAAKTPKSTPVTYSITDLGTAYLAKLVALSATLDDDDEEQAGEEEEEVVADNISSLTRFENLMDKIIKNDPESNAAQRETEALFASLMKEDDVSIRKKLSKIIKGAIERMNERVENGKDGRAGITAMWQVAFRELLGGGYARKMVLLRGAVPRAPVPRGWKD